MRAPRARDESGRTVVPFVLVVVFLCGGCNSNLDPVGTKVGTSAGTLMGEAEACTRGEATTMVYWQPRTALDPPDGGSVYYPGASGGAYLEALGAVDPSANLEFDEPGMAILRCPINVTHAGYYHVWVRAFAHNAVENSVHAGLDEVWPTSGRAVQVCDNPGLLNRWVWTSSQYISNAEPCRGPLAIALEVSQPGAHTLMFSVRESGFRFDSWLLTLDQYLVPGQGQTAAAP